jgi:ATP sulfurylase
VVARPSQRAGGALVIPDEWKANVSVLAEDPFALSSTMVRTLIRNGTALPPEVLKPEVLEYIRAGSLYSPK